MATTAQDIPKDFADDVIDLVTSGDSTTYSARSGPYLFDGFVPCRRDPAEWTRVKNLLDTGERVDRPIGPWDVRRHVAGSAVYGTRINPASGIVVADIDLHLDRLPTTTGTRAKSLMQARVRNIARYLTAWVRGSGGRPLLMTSPGGGYHVWFRLDRDSSTEAVDACRADFRDFLLARGRTPLGEDALDTGVGIDWFPRGGSHVRLPGGRGQVFLDDVTLLPLEGHGSIANGLRRRIVPGITTFRGWMTHSARVRTVPGTVTLQSRVNKPSAWDLACKLARPGIVEPVSDAPESRWTGVPIGAQPVMFMPVAESDLVMVPTRPAGRRRGAIYIGAAQRTGNPVELPAEIVRGDAFSALMLSAETNGIACTGSVSEFSAARKLAYRARGTGITDTTGLVEYLDGIFAVSDLGDEQVIKIQDEAIRAFTGRSPTRSEATSRNDEATVRATRDVPDYVVPSTLYKALGATVRPGLAPAHLAKVLTVTAAYGGEVSTSELSDVIGSARVPGTSSLVAVAARQDLVDAGLMVRARCYRKGSHDSAWALTVSGWTTLIRSWYESPEIIDLDLEQVPDDLRADVLQEVAEFMDLVTVQGCGTGLHRSLPLQGIRTDSVTVNDSG